MIIGEDVAHTSADLPLVKMDEITVRVGNQLLFEQTSWEIKTGQQWAIIGANGSGKSTLAEAICHKVAVVRGRILYYFDRDNNHKAQARPFFNRGEIVMISPEAHRSLMQQQGGYHQARWQSTEGEGSPTVSDLLTGKSIERISPFDVTPMKVSDEVYRRRREKAVELLGIEYLLERKILHLSNGEGRKMLVARALMQSPKLLILDDPFSGLDYASRAALQQVIGKLLSDGNPAIILITPREEEVPPGITHVLRVGHTQVVDHGPKTRMLPVDAEFARRNHPAEADAASPISLQIPAGEPEPAANRSILVQMKDTSITYQGVKVLDGINWTVRQGENWAVLGPNGAGKTTLLSLILADNPQSYANDITIFGRRRGSGESIWDIKREIGWVSPELQVYYHRETSCHNVICSGFFDSVGLYRTCPPEQALTARQWLAELGLMHLADRPLGTVSVGEQRLVLLGRALVKKPALLILDEPGQGLDYSNRTRIIDLLDQLCRQLPVSLIYITHHFDEMPQAITHILKLERGRIQQSGTRQNILGW